METRWYLSRQYDQYSIYLVHVPLRARMLETVWDRLCGASGGWLGGHGMPDWAYKIPLGKARWWEGGKPELRYLDNSLAELFYALESKVFEWSLRKEKEIASIPITRNQAWEIDQKFVRIFEQDEDEDEEDHVVP